MTVKIVEVLIMKTFTMSMVISGWVFLGFVSCSHDTRSFEARVEEALMNRLKEYDVKGASAAIILPDGRVRSLCAGVSADTVTMKPDMLFAIGSITKNMVAALVLQLAEEQLLSLDDPLSRWLPSYPHVDSIITIRQLLNHTSGIYMFWENPKLWEDMLAFRDSLFTPEVVLTYLKKPHFAPGKGFRYSNTNYLLLAMIAVRATHSSLSAEFRRRFWEPLRLGNTYLSMEEPIPQEQLAHVWGDNFQNDGSNRDITFLPRASHESITYGSSGVFTTAGELAQWCHALFHGQVLKKSALDQMLDFNPQATTSWCDGYGLGVQLFKKKITDGERAYGHGGGNIGTSAYMVYLPDRDVSISLMINFFHGKCPDRMLDDIIEIVTEHLASTCRHTSDETFDRRDG
jgi:D-alanyl-D-alanine carboxypeptidase